MTNAPCYECLHRSEICHGSCVEYHAWVAELHEQQKAARVAKDADAHTKRTIEINFRRANTSRRVGQR